MKISSTILDWFVIPLTAAAGFLLTRWGDNNLAFVIGAPIIVLFCRMFVLSGRRLELPTADDPQLRRGVANWHALGIVACLFLMAFEAGVAVMAEVRVTHLLAWAAFIGCTYVPFVLVNLAAERCLPESFREEPA